MDTRSLLEEMWYINLSVCYLSCHIPEWKFTQSEGKGTPCSQQKHYLKYKWLERDSNSQLHLVHKWILYHYATEAYFSLIIELNCEFLSVWCKWQWVICHVTYLYWVKRHSKSCLKVKEPLARNRRITLNISD